MDGNMAMILGIIVVVFVVVCVFLSFVPLGLWISALSSGVHVSMGALIGMKIRHIKPHRLVQPLIKANKAGLGLNISQLETHFLAGGNVDRERFLADVLRPLRAGEPFSYRPFDCHPLSLAAPVPVAPAKLCVVEGSYSCHPALWAHYDLRVFLTVAPEEQMRRIEKRNGPEKAVMFAQRWIPFEEQYFKAFDLQARCDIALQG